MNGSLQSILFRIADHIARPTAIRKRGDIATAHIEVMSLLAELVAYVTKHAEADALASVRQRQTELYGCLVRLEQRVDTLAVTP